VLGRSHPGCLSGKNTFGTLFEIRRVMKIERKQTIQTFVKGGKETMENKLAVKKERFLFNVEKALRQQPIDSTVEETTVDNVILRDLVMLENISSSGSVFLTPDLDANVNINQSADEDINVIANLRNYVHSTN